MIQTVMFHTNYFNYSSYANYFLDETTLEICDVLNLILFHYNLFYFITFEC